MERFPLSSINLNKDLLRIPDQTTSDRSFPSLGMWIGVPFVKEDQWEEMVEQKDEEEGRTKGRRVGRLFWEHLNSVFISVPGSDLVYLRRVSIRSGRRRRDEPQESGWLRLRAPNTSRGRKFRSGLYRDFMRRGTRQTESRILYPFKSLFLTRPTSLSRDLRSV